LDDGKLRALTFRFKSKHYTKYRSTEIACLSEVKFTNQKELIRGVLKNTAVITPEDADKAQREGQKAIRGLKIWLMQCR